MCRISTLLDPPRVVPLNIQFAHGFQATSACNCDCQLLPEEIAQISHDLKKNLRIKLPSEEKLTEKSLSEESLDSGIDSLESSPPESPKPKKSKKSVRFADDCGQDLEHIQLIPSRRAHARKLFTVMISLEKLNNAVEEKTKILENFEVISEQTETVKESCQEEEKKATPWQADFELPKDSSKKLFEQLGKNVVTLANFSLKEDQMSFSGSIWTMNFGPEKAVSVRFTTDNWQSYFERPAKFDESPASIYDIFSFAIEIPAISSKHNKLDFCICYTVNGSTFWDSNNGKNYSISRNVPTTVPTPQLSRRDVFLNRRSGKAEAQKRLNEIDWKKFETLEEKTDVKFSIF